GLSSIFRGDRDAWITLLIGLAMTASTAAYLVTDRRRSAEVHGLIERLSAEISERRESEQRLRWLVENAPDAIITLNADGSLASVNPAAERAFRRPARELLSRSFADLVHGDDRSRVLEVIGAARSGKPSLAEVRIPTRTSEPLFMEFAVTPEFDLD